MADPLGNKSRRIYDQVSRLVGLIDPNGRSYGFDYNRMDWVTQVKDSMGQETTFWYDPNGNLSWVKDAKKQKRDYSYDVKNRMASMTDPLGYSETYEYDLNDNLVKFVDRKKQPQTHTYDRLSRRAETTYDDGRRTEYAYDTVSRLVRVDDSISGPIEFAYSTYGCGTCSTRSPDRIIKGTTSLGIVEYTYDELGRRTSMTVNGRPTVNYRYDDASRLIEVTQEGLGTVAIDPDEIGRRKSLTLPNGVKTEYAFDLASRLLSMKHSTPTGIIEELTYAYDASGNRISFSRLNPQAELPKGVTAAFNAANQMFSFNDENLSYDANGNLIEKKDGLGTTTYTWDARNQLTEITGPGLSASFKYDAFGRRIEKVINGKAIQYLYDGMDIATEIEGGAIRATYLRSLNIDEVFARVDGNGIRYYQTDGLGSTIGLTDETGVLKTVYSYDPFGNTSVSGELSDNPFQYTGRENDGTGLYYYRARYYSPELQRFISKDPIGLLGGINLYSYVANNPINWIDPSGLVGIYGGVVGRVIAPTISVEAGGRVIVGTEGNGLRGTVAGSAGFTMLAAGASIGRGWEFGFFLKDVSDFLSANSINIDTPIGGLSIYFDENGNFAGIGVGGPSWGIGVSVIGGDIPFSAVLSGALDWMSSKSNAPCK
jgi:RHS repeat-associated protein